MLVADDNGMPISEECLHWCAPGAPADCNDDECQCPHHTQETPMQDTDIAQAITQAAQYALREFATELDDAERRAQRQADHCNTCKIGQPYAAEALRAAATAARQRSHSVHVEVDPAPDPEPEPATQRPRTRHAILGALITGLSLALVLGVLTSAAVGAWWLALQLIGTVT